MLKTTRVHPIYIKQFFFSHTHCKQILYTLQFKHFHTNLYCASRQVCLGHVGGEQDVTCRASWSSRMIIIINFKMKMTTKESANKMKCKSQK